MMAKSEIWVRASGYFGGELLRLPEGRVNSVEALAGQDEDGGDLGVAQDLVDFVLGDALGGFVLGLRDDVGPQEV